MSVILKRGIQHRKERSQRGNLFRKGGWLLAVLLLATGCMHRAPKQFRFYPPTPDAPHVQFLTKIQKVTDITPPSFLQTVITGSSTKGVLFGKPYGLAVHDGRIYVCDPGLKYVIMVDPTLKKTAFFYPQKIGRPQRPMGITFAKDGSMYVSDVERHQVLYYNPKGQFVRAFGKADEWIPIGVAVYGNKLYVSDNGDHEIEVRDRITGEKLSTIGGPGDKPGTFYRPANLTVDKKGNIFVSDIMNARFQEFGPDGQFIQAVGHRGDRAGDFSRPKGIAVDPDGLVYVVDAAFFNVQVFVSYKGKYYPTMQFGGNDEKIPGALYLPAGIAITKDPKLLKWAAQFRHRDFNVRELILVANEYGPANISIYGFGEARKSSALAKGEGAGAGKSRPEATKDQKGAEKKK